MQVRIYSLEMITCNHHKEYHNFQPLTPQELRAYEATRAPAPQVLPA